MRLKTTKTKNKVKKTKKIIMKKSFTSVMYINGWKKRNNNRKVENKGPICVIVVIFVYYAISA